MVQKYHFQQDSFIFYPKRKKHYSNQKNILTLIFSFLLIYPENIESVSELFPLLADDALSI